MAVTHRRVVETRSATYQLTADEKRDALERAHQLKDKLLQRQRAREAERSKEDSE